MNIAFSVGDREACYEYIGKMPAAPAPYHEGFYPGGTYTFVDTFSELGVELNIKKDEDNTGLIEACRRDPEGYCRH